MKKTSVKSRSSRPDLPQELSSEILSWLPVKSLLRFRCVSRSWKLIIDDPDFAPLHLSRFNNRRESSLFFLQGIPYECLVKNSTTLTTNFSLGFLESDRKSVHVLRSTPAPEEDFIRTWYIVSSSVDGLFMLNCTDSLDLMLWNPSLRKTLLLPPSPKVKAQAKDIDFGLGFDPLIQDYKFVRLIPSRGARNVAIYTLGANSWKTIKFQGEVAPDFISNGGETCPCNFNGALYAFAKYDDWRKRAPKLVSFDLRSEVFASVRLPIIDAPESYPYPQALTIVDDGSSLALVNLSKPKGSIWALEMSGDDIKLSRWIQLYTFAPVIPAYTLDTWRFHFLCLKKNGEMLLESGERVICYNLKTQQEKIMMLEENYRGTFYTSPYIESLILHLR